MDNLGTNKRVMIFSPSKRDLDEIALAMEEYIRVELKESHYIDMQKFYSIAESSEKGQSIGCGREILVIFDRRICPVEGRKVSFRKDGEKSALIATALEMSRTYCSKLEIPYIQYEGELTNNGLNAFITKLNNVKKDIIKKLGYQEARIKNVKETDSDSLPSFDGF